MKANANECACQLQIRAGKRSANEDSLASRALLAPRRTNDNASANDHETAIRVNCKGREKTNYSHF